jgi:hypothetical protein
MFGIKKAIRNWLLSEEKPKPKKNKKPKAVKKPRKKRVVTAPGASGYYKMILLLKGKKTGEDVKVIRLADFSSRKDAFAWAVNHLTSWQSFGYRLHNLSIGRIKTENDKYCIAGSKYVYLATSDSWRKA